MSDKTSTCLAMPWQSPRSTYNEGKSLKSWDRPAVTERSRVWGAYLYAPHRSVKSRTFTSVFQQIESRKATKSADFVRTLRSAERVGPLSTVDNNFTKSQFFFYKEQGLAFYIRHFAYGSCWTVDSCFLSFWACRAEHLRCEVDPITRVRYNTHFPNRYCKIPVDFVSNGISLI